MANETNQTTAKPAAETTINGMSINWIDDKMESLYSNVGTATANREEFFLLFGTHQNWRGNEAESKTVDVELSKRIVMSPFAAKRLSVILQHALRAYEEQFGEVKL